MIQNARIRGVLAPVLTAFKADLSPDRERYVLYFRKKSKLLPCFGV